MVFESIKKIDTVVGDFDNKRKLQAKEQVEAAVNHANSVHSLTDTRYQLNAVTSSQSQITQLSDMINLRVSKGDVTSQINLESGIVLIDTNQLLLNANTVKFSGSAFIPDAMIQALIASKINVGTLNGANVNIINLNASNISAGTITGPNLSINLNSGEVLFQKGIIKRQDGNFSVDITNGILESYTSSGGYTLRDGEISFRDTSAWKPNSREKYGGIVVSLFQLTIGPVDRQELQYPNTSGITTTQSINLNISRFGDKTDNHSRHRPNPISKLLVLSSSSNQSKTNSQLMSLSK